MIRIKIHFSDYFDVDPKLITDYGGFDVSLIQDLPLFIDPFLLFNSKKPEYQELHEEIIKYLKFLRDVSTSENIPDGLLEAWFHFPEVRQTWLGYSESGNHGRGLGNQFATALHKNLNAIFSNFGNEQITFGSHLEKLCLIRDGVGRDMISDFTTNLIKGYLLTYTEKFAAAHISPRFRKRFSVNKVRFNYDTRSWENDVFDLPSFENDYILLTPRDILTRVKIWINRPDLIAQFNEIAFSIPNSQLRWQIDDYVRRRLSQFDNPTKKDREKIIADLLLEYPVLADYYIRYKEDTGDEAVSISSERVSEALTLYVEQLSRYVQLLAEQTSFYDTLGDTYQESLTRVAYLKNFIENQGGHRIFFVGGKPVRREEDLQRIFRLVWCGTPSTMSSEVNDGRGPVDFKISRGACDITLVEFKIGSNSKLEQNLQNQVEIYKKASGTDKSLKVIVYFDYKQEKRVKSILNKLGLGGHRDIVLIDARADNKPSGSNA